MGVESALALTESIEKTKRVVSIPRYGPMPNEEPLPENEAQDKSSGGWLLVGWIDEWGVSGLLNSRVDLPVS